MDKPFTLRLLCLFLPAIIFIDGSDGRSDIYYLHVHTDIKYRFATTVVTSKVVNRGLDTARETMFTVTLPKEAFITSFVLIRNDTEFHGKVKEKSKAQLQYDESKKKGQTAGHIRVSPRDTNTFQIQVNVGPGEKVTFELTYQELLHRVLGIYSHVIFINPGQEVDDFRISVDIDESRNITQMNVSQIGNQKATVQQPTENTAHITYSTDKRNQSLVLRQGYSTKFEVKYDVDRGHDAGDLLVVDGYFVHFFAPSGFNPLPLDILFILDRSGSMKGTKIAQLQKAMTKILDDMRAQDRFSLITFDYSTNFWSNELQFATTENIKSAKKYVNDIKASGGTNINQAMMDGFRLLQRSKNSTRVPVMIFLTDGKPTIGIIEPSLILLNVRNENYMDKLPIFSLAFGEDADYEFVKKVSGQNNGVGRRIYEDADPALQITGFYDEMSTVLLRDITFRYLSDSVIEKSLTKHEFKSFFGGSEFIVAGRLLRDFIRSLDFVVSGRGSDGSFSFYKPDNSAGNYITFDASKKTLYQNITEKMWAYLTIKQILKKMDSMSYDKQAYNDLHNKALYLCLKYQFVTPLTSMVVTLPKKSNDRPSVGSMNEDILELEASVIENSVHLTKAENVIGTADSQKKAGGPLSGAVGLVRSRVRKYFPRLSKLFSVAVRNIPRRIFTKTSSTSQVSNSRKVQQARQHSRGTQTTLSTQPQPRNRITTVATTVQQHTSTDPTSAAKGAPVAKILLKVSSQQTSSVVQNTPTKTPVLATQSTSATVPRAVGVKQATPQPARNPKNSIKQSKNRRYKQKRENPLFLIRIPGLNYPLCPRFDLNPSTTYLLLAENTTGTEVKIRTGIRTKKGRKGVLFDQLTEVKYKKDSSDTEHTILPDAHAHQAKSDTGLTSNFSISGMNISIDVSFGSQGAQDDRRLVTFDWLSTNDDVQGIMGFFNGFTGRVIKTVSRRGKTIGKVKLMKQNQAYRIRAIEVPLSETKSDRCWFVNKRGVASLGIRFQDYEAQ